MNNDKYQNYNYTPHAHVQEHYDQESVFSRILKSPVLAIGSLMLVGAAFAGAIIMTYTHSSDDGVVPIVQAQNESFKSIPDQPGGLNVPFQDSTVFDSLAGAEIQEVAPVENLLSSGGDVARLDAFAAEAERLIQQSEATRQAAQVRSLETAALIEQATGVATPTRPAGSALNATEPASGGDAGASVPSENLLQKIEAGSQPGELYRIVEVEQPTVTPEAVIASVNTQVQEQAQEQVVASVAIPSSKPQVTAQASVPSAQDVAAIAPAAGFVLSSGSHYVQLGSVKSQAGASAEWGKFKKKYAAELSDSKYRVQRADLGERGTFYRIQAGPMSADSASEICGSIKAKAPGGCLVVK